MLQPVKGILKKAEQRGKKHLNPFTPNSAKSKICYKLGKIEQQIAPMQSTAQQLSNLWSHFRALYIESKVRKLCITQGFILGVDGLTTTGPYWDKVHPTLETCQAFIKVLNQSFYAFFLQLFLNLQICNNCLLEMYQSRWKSFNHFLSVEFVN